MKTSMTNDKLKIAHVVCVLPPYGGGMGMVANAYADQLIEKGHDVTVFIPKNKKKADYSKKNFTVKQLFPLIRFGHAAVMPSLLWKLWKFDVIHFHYPFYGSSMIPAIIKMIKGDKVKFILSYHMDNEGTGIRKKIFDFYKNVIAPFVLKKADKVVVSSEDYIENSNIQEFYYNNVNKFVELPFGVPKRYKPMPKDHELLNKYHLSPNDFVVLFVGGLDSAHYFKGINFLIKAIERIDNKNIKALVIGDGNLRPMFEEKVIEKHLQKRIKFTGYVAGSELPKHFNLGDVFALPSINKSEAFGIVLIEAMSCGKPLIASNLKGVRTVVDQGINGLLTEPKNSQDLANKIEYLYSNPEKVKEFGQRGLETVNEKYRWSIIGDKLEKLYFSLFNETKNN